MYLSICIGSIWGVRSRGWGSRRDDPRTHSKNHIAACAPIFWSIPNLVSEMRRSTKHLYRLKSKRLTKSVVLIGNCYTPVDAISSWHAPPHMMFPWLGDYTETIIVTICLDALAMATSMCFDVYVWSCCSTSSSGCDYFLFHEVQGECF